MQAKNLRIGNFILFPTKTNEGLLIPTIIRKVDMIECGKVVSLNSPTYPTKFEVLVRNCSGIKLNEVHLENAGFKKNIDYEKGLFILKKDYRMGKILWYIYFNGILLTEIKYVHELQNIFFAIDGNELSFDNKNKTFNEFL